MLAVAFCFFVVVLTALCVLVSITSRRNQIFSFLASYAGFRRPGAYDRPCCLPSCCGVCHTLRELQNCRPFLGKITQDTCVGTCRDYRVTQAKIAQTIISALAASFAVDRSTVDIFQKMHSLHMTATCVRNALFAFAPAAEPSSLMM